MPAERRRLPRSLVSSKSLFHHAFHHCLDSSYILHSYVIFHKVTNLSVCSGLLYIYIYIYDYCSQVKPCVTSALARLKKKEGLFLNFPKQSTVTRLTTLYLCGVIAHLCVKRVQLYLVLQRVFSEIHLAIYKDVLSQKFLDTKVWLQTNLSKSY